MIWVRNPLSISRPPIRLQAIDPWATDTKSTSIMHILTTPTPCSAGPSSLVFRERESHIHARPRSYSDELISIQPLHNLTMKRDQGADALLSMTILTLDPVVWALGWAGAEAGGAGSAPHSAEIHTSFYLSDVIGQRSGFVVHTFFHSQHRLVERWSDLPFTPLPRPSDLSSASSTLADEPCKTAFLTSIDCSSTRSDMQGI